MGRKKKNTENTDDQIVATLKKKLTKIHDVVLDHIYIQKVVTNEEALRYINQVTEVQKRNQSLGDYPIAQVSDKLIRQLKAIIKGVGEKDSDTNNRKYSQVQHALSNENSTLRTSQNTPSDVKLSKRKGRRRKSKIRSNNTVTNITGTKIKIKQVNKTVIHNNLNNETNTNRPCNNIELQNDSNISQLNSSTLLQFESNEIDHISKQTNDSPSLLDGVEDMYDIGKNCKEKSTVNSNSLTAVNVLYSHKPNEITGIVNNDITYLTNEPIDLTVDSPIENNAYRQSISETDCNTCNSVNIVTNVDISKPISKTLTNLNTQTLTESSISNKQNCLEASSHNAIDDSNESNKVAYNYYSKTSSNVIITCTDTDTTEMPIINSIQLPQLDKKRFELQSIANKNTDEAILATEIPNIISTLAKNSLTLTRTGVSLCEANNISQTLNYNNVVLSENINSDQAYKSHVNVENYFHVNKYPPNNNEMLNKKSIKKIEGKCQKVFISSANDSLKSINNINNSIEKFLNSDSCNSIPNSQTSILTNGNLNYLNSNNILLKKSSLKNTPKAKSTTQKRSATRKRAPKSFEDWSWIKSIKCIRSVLAGEFVRENYLPTTGDWCPTIDDDDFK